MISMNPEILIGFAGLIILALVLVLLLWQTRDVAGVLKVPKTTFWKALPYYGLILLILSGFGLMVYINDWQAHVLNWLNLIIRWTHVIIGIAWIGASFYFVFLENSLNRTQNLRDELAGNLWAIHGGGFYYVEKYKLAPKEIPQDLHWFKYEAYFTWITGFLLLIVVYYAQAHLTMVGDLKLSPALAVTIGIGSLVFGWLVYDLLCRSPLIHRPVWFFIIMFLFIVALAWVLSYLLSPKAAYIHVGAAMGTMMAGNVFQVIIPSQKALVHAATNNQPLDPWLGKHAGLRSLHNNYFTLPVVFIMISNHFPSTFGHPYNWAILAGLILVSTAIRHYLNLAEKGKQAFWILPIATLGTVVLAMVTAPPKLSDEAMAGPVVPIQEVMTIVQNHCVSCHSATPTDNLWVIAPNGVMFDTPEQVAAMQSQIMARVVVAKNMPLGNQSQMTDQERAAIGRWIQQGAPIN